MNLELKQFLSERFSEKQALTLLQLQIEPPVFQLEWLLSQTHTCRVISDKNRYAPTYTLQVLNQYWTVEWSWRVDMSMINTDDFTVVWSWIVLNASWEKYDMLVMKRWESFILSVQDHQVSSVSVPTTPPSPSTQPQNRIDMLAEQLVYSYRIESNDGRIWTVRDPNDPTKPLTDQDVFRSTTTLLIWYEDQEGIVQTFSVNLPNVHNTSPARFSSETTLQIDNADFKLMHTNNTAWRIVKFSLHAVDKQWIVIDSKKQTQHPEVLVGWDIDWYKKFFYDNTHAPRTPANKMFYGHYRKPRYDGTAPLSQVWQQCVDNLVIKKLSDNYVIHWTRPDRRFKEYLAEFTVDDIQKMTQINATTYQWVVYNHDKSLQRNITLSFPTVDEKSVMHLAINSYPPSLWLSEDDEKIKQKDITRFDWAYNLTFQWLPILWTWAQKVELRWFENKHTTTPVAYEWTDYISEEQKNHIESLFLTQKDANTPHILTLKWNNKFFGWTLIPSTICEIDLHDTSKWSYVDWHWCYTTLDANDEEIVMQARTHPENLTKTHQWPVLSIAILKVGPRFGEAFSIKDIPVLPVDFSGISDTLKKTYHDIKDSDDFKNWLKEVNKYYEKMKDALSDVVVERISEKNINKLSWEELSKFWAEVATHYDTKIYPLWSNVTADDLRFLECQDGSDDKDMYLRFNKPWVFWTDKIADIPYKSGASNPQSYSVDVTDLTIDTKNFWADRRYTFSGTIRWMYQYEVTTMVNADWKEKKVIRISVQPPQEYIDFMRNEFEPKLEGWLDKLQNKLTFPATSKIITAPYNEIRSWRRHKWIDIGKDWGDLHALAAYDWVVTHVQTQTDAQWNITWYGTYVIVQHEYQWKKFRTVYAHLNQEWLVSVWDTVSAWKKIWRAEHRSDKRWTATWQHVHFELRVQDATHKESVKTHTHDWRRDVDPMLYFTNTWARWGWQNPERNQRNPHGHPIFNNDFTTRSIDQWWYTISFSMKPNLLFYDNNIAEKYIISYTEKNWTEKTYTFDQISWINNPNNLHPKYKNQDWEDSEVSNQYAREIPDIKPWTTITITWPNNIPSPVNISHEVK